MPLSPEYTTATSFLLRAISKAIRQALCLLCHRGQYKLLVRVIPPHQLYIRPDSRYSHRSTAAFARPVGSYGHSCPARCLPQITLPRGYLHFFRCKGSSHTILSCFAHQKAGRPHHSGPFTTLSTPVTERTIPDYEKLPGNSQKLLLCIKFDWKTILFAIFQQTCFVCFPPASPHHTDVLFVQTVFREKLLHRFLDSLGADAPPAADPQMQHRGMIRSVVSKGSAEAGPRYTWMDRYSGE